MVEVLFVTGYSGTESMNGLCSITLQYFVCIFLLILEKGFNFSKDPIYSCVQMNVWNFHNQK